MVGMKWVLLIVSAAVFMQVHGQSEEQSCPPEWSFVHQCWKSFEMRYKQFGNNTALTVKQMEIQEMCSCMAKAVTQTITDANVEIIA